MKSNRIICIASARITLALLAAVSVVGCELDEERSERDDMAALALGDGSVQFQGFEHRALGRATLEVKEGGLDVTGMASMGVDGVSIQLREVTEWIPEGSVTPGRGGLHLEARSIAEGISTSTLTIDEDEDNEGEYSIRTAFTGRGQGTTYSVVVYMGDSAVGSTAREVNPKDGVIVVIRTPIVIPHFRVVQRPLVIPVADGSSIDVNEGACQFTLPSNGELMVVTLPDGRRIEGDRLEFIETVPASGSYPYHGFNAMEYTAAGGSFTFTREAAH